MIDEQFVEKAKSFDAITTTSSRRQISDFELGAIYRGGGVCSFRVWAPEAKSVAVCLGPDDRRELLTPNGGYHWKVLEGILPGTRYCFRLEDGEPLPDPASRHQPDSVHAASAVVDSSFDWDDQAWVGLPWRDYIIYELHVGTFTREGTFEAIIPRLRQLKALGITAIEIMPVAQFPGIRNWGYDGVYPFAVQNSYGGPKGLKTLVNACHQEGIAVVLDVVYNHFGPEGNYLRKFGPYFTDAYKTPWGDAINFDGEQSDHVRQFFFENALYWQKEFHIDALRLDAVHAIRDFSAKPFLQELAEKTQWEAERRNRPFHLIAESDLNDARLIRPSSLGGFGLAAQWSDDFHHCLHALLTGEKTGYYGDFGGVKQLAKIFREGYAYTGQYSSFRKRRHGNSPQNLPRSKFVVYSQNHDQIGNRLAGERLTALISPEKQKLAAGAVLLAPFVPLIFMGEEYGEPAPFQYFVSHSDPALIEAVRKGRQAEFSFSGDKISSDPFAPATFVQCVLNWDLLTNISHQKTWSFYQELIRLRKKFGALFEEGSHSIEVESLCEDILSIRYFAKGEKMCVLFNFSEIPEGFVLEADTAPWTIHLDSADASWGGPGSQLSGKIFHGSKRIEIQPTSFVLMRAVLQETPENEKTQRKVDGAVDNTCAERL
jgi:maltooligosyltrehalose trehalohydrolase